MRLRVISTLIFLTVVGFLSPAILFAQTAGDSTGRRGEYLLSIQSLKDGSLLKKISFRKSFPSKKERDKEMQNVLFTCYDNAYLTAFYDSVYSDSLITKAYLNFGAQYKWARLKKGNVDEGVLSEIGFREKVYSNKPIYFKSVKRIQEKLILVTA